MQSLLKAVAAGFPRSETNMSDHFLPLAYFMVLAVIAVLGAVSGARLGKPGLLGLFALVWPLLTIAWLAIPSSSPMSVGLVFGVGTISAFALIVTCLPMLVAIKGRSFFKLLALGLFGAAISSVASLIFGVAVACLLGDCL